MSSQAIAQDVWSYLLSKALPPNALWLTNFLSSQKNSVPLPALKQTAFFRIIQTDITKSIQRDQTTEFPADIQDAEVRERRLHGVIPVQVLDVEDIGTSKWSQLEAIEAEERGETSKGREIIRVVPREDGEQDVSFSKGPHKLLLQDVRGAQIYGIEIAPVDGVGLGMSIGSKILLKDATVARGALLLEPNTVTALGGKIDDLHRSWKSTRKAALKSDAQTSAALR